MTAKAFLDTNIFIYALDRHDQKKRKQAKALLLKLAGTGNVVVSTQVVQEVYVTCVNKLSIPALEAKRWISYLEKFELVVLSLPLIKEAIDISILNQLSFWDGLIVAAAEAAGCETLYTEDLNTGQVIRGVEVADPF